MQMAFFNSTDRDGRLQAPQWPVVNSTPTDGSFLDDPRDLGFPVGVQLYHHGPNEIELNLGQHGFAASGTVHRELLWIWREVVLNHPSSVNTEPAQQSVFQVNISSVYVACRSKQLLGSNTNFHLAKHHYTPASSDRRRCEIGTEVTRSRRSSRSSDYHYHRRIITTRKVAVLVMRLRIYIQSTGLDIVHYYSCANLLQHVIVIA